MSENRAIFTLAARKCTQKLGDAVTEINRKTKNGPKLDHDRVHFPIAIGKRYVEQVLGYAQMRRRADWQKLRQSFDNSQKNG